MEQNEALVYIFAILVMGIVIIALKDILYQLGVLVLVLGGAISFGWFKVKGK
jgi:hypothetical protein